MKTRKILASSNTTRRLIGKSNVITRLNGHIGFRIEEIPFLRSLIPNIFTQRLKNVRSFFRTEFLYCYVGLVKEAVWKENNKVIIFINLIEGPITSIHRLDTA